MRDIRSWCAHWSYHDQIFLIDHIMIIYSLLIISWSNIPHWPYHDQISFTNYVIINISLIDHIMIKYVSMIIYLSSVLMIPCWRNCCSASCQRSASLSWMGGAALNRRSPKNPGPLFCTISCIIIVSANPLPYLPPVLWPHKELLNATINYFTYLFSLAWRSHDITWYHTHLTHRGHDALKDMNIRIISITRLNTQHQYPTLFITKIFTHLYMSHRKPFKIIL